MEIRTDDGALHRQGEVLTALLHELRASDAPDWILPLDADEFLRPADARDGLRILLSQLPTNAVTLLPWATYVPLPEDDPREERVLRRIRHRKETEEPQFYKILLPSAFHGDRYIIPLGSHGLADLRAEPCPHVKCPALRLAHFPVRSAAQIRTKVTLGWQSHRIDPRRTPGQTYQWERLHAEFARDPAIPPERLRDIALGYTSVDGHPTQTATVQDPVRPIVSGRFRRLRRRVLSRLTKAFRAETML